MDLEGIDLGEIEKIISSLSPQDMEMLSSLAGQFFSDDREDKKQKDKKQESFSFADMPIDFETIRKISSVMTKINSQPQDPRCEFLLSLKPMLSRPRQQKVDTAVSMLRMMSLLPLINEL